MKQNDSMEADSGMSIFDQITGKNLDILQVALLDVASKSHLPEIFSIFGKDTFLKFLDVFSGCTISVPQRKIIEDAIRDTQIYLILRKVGVDAQAPLVRTLAERYDTSPGTIRRKFVEMEKKLKRYQFHDAGK